MNYQKIDKTNFTEDFKRFFNYGFAGIEYAISRHISYEHDSEYFNWNPFIKRAISLGHIMNVKYCSTNVFPVFEYDLFRFFTKPFAQTAKLLPNDLYEEGMKDLLMADLFQKEHPLFRETENNNFEITEYGTEYEMDFYKEVLHSSHPMAEYAQKETFAEMSALSQDDYIRVRSFLTNPKNSCILFDAKQMAEEWQIENYKTWEEILDLQGIFNKCYKKVLPPYSEEIHYCKDCGFIFNGRFKNAPYCKCGKSRETLPRLPNQSVYVMQDFALEAYLLPGHLENDIKKVLEKAVEKKIIQPNFDIWPGYNSSMRDTWDFKFKLSDEQLKNIQSKKEKYNPICKKIVALDAKDQSCPWGISEDNEITPAQGELIYIVPDSVSNYFTKSVRDSGKTA